MKRSVFGVVVLLVGSLVGVSSVAAVDIGDFVNRLETLEKAQRQEFVRSLTDVERRNLHEQYRALPSEIRAGYAQVLNGGHTADKPAAKSTRVVGTVQYDTGVANVNRVSNADVVGNRFNTGFVDPHSIATVTLQMGGVFSGTNLSVFGAPAGSTAPVLTSALISGLPVGALTPVVLGLPVTGHSGTFMVGVDQSGTSTTPSTTFGHVAVDINDAGFGFHGMSIIQGGGGGYNASPMVLNAAGGQVPFNAILRTTGDNLPVELMRLGVE